jgi:hypothetical protein
MRSTTGHRAALEEIATTLAEEVIRPEMQGDDPAWLIREAPALGVTFPTSRDPESRLSASHEGSHAA